MDGTEGYYDLYFTKALQEKLVELRSCGMREQTVALDKGAAMLREMAGHISGELLHYLMEQCDGEKEENYYAAICSALQGDAFRQFVSKRLVPSDEMKLLALYDEAKHPNVKRSKPEDLPDTPLASSALFTGAAHSRKLYVQLQKELLTCDRADWLVSFIKMSAINTLRPVLERFTSTPAPDGQARLRILTTTYMGATDAKAVEYLSNLPNTEVRVSYDTRSTRLHAKSYIFQRNSGFGSAYVGSSNLSKVAMDQGLEWNIKVSQRELPYLWNAAVAAFDTHWEDQQCFRVYRAQEDFPLLREHLARERGGEALPDDSPISFFDLHPFPYQEETLEAIARERSIGKNRHLIVAATGTGKTMIAAFDFRRFLTKHRGARLLFVAHRVEILLQAREKFRQVLKDGSFGMVVNGDNKPTGDGSWFCTIQTWRNIGGNVPDDYFQYVVVDEAHHEAASSYSDVTQRLRPLSMLGLTATPERADGISILDSFGGYFTHELRLPEAIERGLLSPFVYYGLADFSGVDFSRLTWERGHYKTEELEQMLLNNTQRAEWVMEQIKERVEDIRRIHAIGFCVSVAHAQFMQRVCEQHQLPTLALTAASSKEEREDANRRLRSGEICIIFTVDLYNEGVDLPYVDTVIFLRPTESLTVFLQQLGRGLRRDKDKECLSVFDFIAAQNKNFSYARRFEALSGCMGTVRVQNELQNGFQSLPGGCMICLEKQACDVVLNNIKENLKRMKADAMAEELRRCRADRAAYGASGSPLSLEEILNVLDLRDDPDALYARSRIPSELQRVAGDESVPEAAEDAEAVLPLSECEPNLATGMRRLLLQTDGDMLQAAQACLREGKVTDRAALSSLYSVLWFGKKRPGSTLEAVHSYVCAHPGLKRDIEELIGWLRVRRALYQHPTFEQMGRLRLHATYTREQVLQALGESTFEKSSEFREGVRYIKEKNLYILMADINKSASDFSPTTMYDDYAISDTLFHWQTQSSTSPTSKTGQNYIRHQERHIGIMLFIRDRKTTPQGVASPYTFLGPVEYVSHTGSKPMSIRWRLLHPIPASVLSWARRELI